MLDRLDAYRIGIDIERTRRFARCRTNAPGKIGKVVGRMQYDQRLLPVAAINEVVPVGNDVVDRAPGIAKRDPAIHAACALDTGLFVGQDADKLAVMFEA
jgi:hypothetical protein